MEAGLSCLEGNENLNKMSLHLPTSEWPKSRTQTPPNAGKDANRNVHSFLVEMQNGTATLGDSLVASHNIKYIFTIWSSNCPAGIYPQELKTYVCTKNRRQMFIAALLVITQTEATKMSSSRWVDKQTVAHPDDRMVVGPKKQMSDQAMKESSGQMKGVNLRRLYTEWVQLYNILEKAKTMETIKKKVRCCLKSWREKWMVRAQRIFLCVLSHSVVCNSCNPIDCSLPGSLCMEFSRQKS